MLPTLAMTLLSINLVTFCVNSMCTWQPTSVVSRPSAPWPVRKLEREKRKEGLVNRPTTSCSSAGMLVEVIKT